MANRLNTLLENQLRADFLEIDNLLLIDYQGLDSEKMAAFRTDLRSKGLKMRVVKNAVFKIATKDIPAGRIVEDPNGQLSGENPFDGPVGVITGGETAIDCARFAVEWLKKNKETIQLKAALMGEEVFASGQVVELSKLPSRQELLGMMANIVQTPIQKLAATVQTAYLQIAWGMNALAEKLEKA